MVREILKLKTDNGLGVNNPSFKNIEITEYSFKSPRMGIPALTAELLWPSCLDNEWTGAEYVELRGERYYIRQVQSSEISNNNVIKYRHSLDFKSEREQLLHVYFYDVVPSGISQSNSAGHDKPNTNSTKFKIYATPREFCDRLNCAFRYAGIGDSILETKTSLTDLDTPAGDGYCVVLSGYGDGDLEQSQEFEWEDKYLFDALSEGFDKFKIPFCFHGKKVVFNEYVEPIEHVFKYGFDDALLSVKKSNANARIINRITFKGSNENIPYFYPNKTEYGEANLIALETNKVLVASDLHIESVSSLVRNATSNANILLAAEYVTPLIPKGQFLNIYDELNDRWEAIALNEWSDFNTKEVRIRCYFDIFKAGDVIITGIFGDGWRENTASPTNGSQGYNNLIAAEGFKIKSLILISDSGSEDLTSCAYIDNDSTIHLNNLPHTANTSYYCLEFSVTLASDSYLKKIKISKIESAPEGVGSYYWVIDDSTKKISLDAIGVSISKDVTADMIGDGFKWTASGRMPFQENLMPPKYRETLGTERFYNALNNTYLKPDGKTYYTFKNPYVDGNPNEYIHTDETIKPTIEGVKNSKEELFGVISGIAFDSDDNDSLKGDADSEDKNKNDSANYAHSFFYLRLNKFDGEHGFDLFNSASQTAPMTIQMTSGKCNGCKFKIQVIEEDKLNNKQWRNPVQTKSADGDIIYGTQSQIINKNNPQEWQQDTKKNYIWIAVQKDAETFGVIMPNRTHNYLPSVGDTFNIINIYLPQGYIDAAEERGMYAVLDFMEDNNEEKFNFDITASRIFFAENSDLLALLNENSRIKIEYNGEQYVQYVSEFAIDCKDNEVLPDVKLTLANTLEPSGDFVEEVVAQTPNYENIGKGGRGSGGGLTTELADRRYVCKDKDDRTGHRISSDTAFEVGNFVSGSQGGIMFVDPETGLSTIEVDYFKARIKAIFETLEIAHVQSIGGKMIITPGGSIDISFVEELPDAYRCYFKQQEETEGADCRFIVGDDVICQSFNISNGSHQNASNKYYWRKVKTVSNDGSYVELSKTDCAAGSDVPEIGDTICQLGSDDVSRQSAIILSTVDTFSPNITLYDGVTDFTLIGKEMVDMGVDKTTHKAYFHVYGNAYIGDKAGNSFLKYDNLLKLLEIKAKLQIGTTIGDQTLEEYIQQVSPPVEQEDIEQFVNNIVDPKLEGIQNQIDGVIESFFGFGAPTLTNYPANEWTTNEAKKAHANDTYTDKTEYVDDTTTPTAGQSWKWQYTSPIDYGWVKIADSDAVKALLDAAKAQDTADSKRRAFTVRPKPPYDEGDIWMNATYPAGNTEKDPANKKYCNDILRCNADVHKSTGSFSINDWGLASDYTDDSLAQDAINRIAGYEYLKNALLPENPTQIIGGLIMSTLISLVYTDSASVRHTMAGMNGSWVNSLGGRTIGSWWGGDILDRFDTDDNRLNETGLRYATSLIRMDGSAYFSDGLVGFKKNGGGWLAGDNITWDENGAMTFGNGIKIDLGGEESTTLGNLQSSVSSVMNAITSLTKFLTPVGLDENGNQVEIAWKEASLTDNANGGYRAKSIKAKLGFWSTEYISARGQDTTSGGGGIFGLYTDSTWASDALATDALSASLGKTLYNRILSLENKNYLDTLNILPSGSGNAVTALELSSDKKNLTYVKGTTFVTTGSVQEISGSKTFLSGLTVKNTVTSGASARHLAFTDSDNANHCAFGSYIEDGVFNRAYIGWGDYPWRMTSCLSVSEDRIAYKDNSLLHTANYASILDSRYLQKTVYTASDVLAKIKTVDGSGSGLDADLLDGVNNGYLTARFLNTSSSSSWDCNDPQETIYADYGTSDRSITNAPDGWKFGALLTIGRLKSYSTALSAQFMWDVAHNQDSPGTLWFRTKDSASGWRGWGRLAFITDNVASADKLHTARKIWGQNFDGTADVSGNLSGVGSITATSHLNIYAGSRGYMVIHDDSIGSVTIGQPNSSPFLFHVNGSAHVNLLHLGQTTISYDTATGAVHVQGNLYADGYLSCRGADAAAAAATSVTEDE